ncbi:MAG: nuclear transport factor 2 family protein [Solirubrobacterales bacterium]
MSEGNVEVVQRSWKAWGRRDVASALALFAENIEWDMTHFERWPEHQHYRGIEEVRRFLTEWLGAWDDYEAGLERAFPAGENTVVAFCWQRGRGIASGIEAEQSWAQVLTLSEGLIVRTENFSSREQALREAGLEP